MKKYGVENFVIEQIDSAETAEELGEKERKYILLFNTQVPSGYNLTAGGERNQLDGNPRAKLTQEDVLEIRKIYVSRTMSCGSCYELYKERISYSAFEKIWEGTTWKSISPEVYTVENRDFYMRDGRQFAGEKNPNSLSDDDKMLQARIYYVSHTLQQTYECYGKNYASIDAFRSALTQGYAHLPIYKKQKGVWVFHGQIIDFKPVSTISESGE